MTVIWFTYKEDHELVEAVQQAGHTCLLATSEIVIRHLVAEYSDSTIIVGHDIAPDRAQSIQRKFPTLTITPTTTGNDILIELGLMMSRQKPAN